MPSGSQVIDQGWFRPGGHDHDADVAVLRDRGFEQERAGAKRRVGPVDPRRDVALSGRQRRIDAFGPHRSATGALSSSRATAAASCRSPALSSLFGVTAPASSTTSPR